MSYISRMLGTSGLRQGSSKVIVREYITTPELHGWSNAQTSTANTASFQAAIDAANVNAALSDTGRGVVELEQSKLYTVIGAIGGSQCLVAKDNVEIRTVGKPVTSGLKARVQLDGTIDDVTPVHTVSLFRVWSRTNCWFRSIIVDGNRDNITNIGGTADRAMYGIRIRGGQGHRLYHVECVECVTDGLEISAASGGTPADPEYYPTDILAEDCLFDLNGRDGVSIIACGRMSLTWNQVVFRRCAGNRSGDKPAGVKGTQNGSGWQFETNFGRTWENIVGLTLEDCSASNNRGSSQFNYVETGVTNWGPSFVFSIHTTDSDGADFHYTIIRNFISTNNRARPQLRLDDTDGPTLCSNLLIDGLVVTGTTAEANALNFTCHGGTALVTHGLIRNADVSAITFDSNASVSHTLAIAKGAFNPTVSGTFNTVTYATTESLAPDSLLVASNLSGTVGNVDEATNASDGDWLTVSVPTSAIDLRASFPTPALALQSGAAWQHADILLRKTPVGLTNPTVDLALYEAGVLRATLATGVIVKDPNEQVVHGSFNASALASSAAASVELRVTGTPSANNTVEIGALRWLAISPGSP